MFQDETEVKACLKEMISIHSPTGKEKTFVDLLVEIFTDLCERDYKDNYTIENEYVGIEESYNLSIKMGAFHDHVPTVILYAHTDTVEVDVEYKENGSLVHGLGTSDIKGTIASYYFLIQDEEIKDLVKQKKVNIILALIAREEVDSAGAAIYTEKLREDLHFKTNKDHYYCVVGEPTNCEYISIGSRANYNIVFKKVFSKSYHSSKKHEMLFADDANMVLLHFMQEVERLQHRLLTYIYPKFEPPSAAITYLRMGTYEGLNVIPDQFEAGLDIRLTPQLWEHDFEIVRHFMRIIKTKFNFEVLREYSGPGHAGSDDDEIVVRLKKAYETVMGKAPTTKVGIASNDSAFFSQIGIKTINKFGPGDDLVVHSHEEYIDIRKMYHFNQIIKTFITDLQSKTDKEQTS